jgi:hypothetical protein
MNGSDFRMVVESRFETKNAAHSDGALACWFS